MGRQMVLLLARHLGDQLVELDLAGTTPNPAPAARTPKSDTLGSKHLCLSGRGTTRAEDAQGTPTQSHISPSILEYEEYTPLARHLGDQLVELDLAGIQGYLAHKKQPPPRTLQ